MNDGSKTKEQRTSEMVEMRQQIAESGTVETDGKRAEDVIQWSGMWLPTAGMFVLLCILVWLNEVLDLPHLLLDAPRTPANWQEAIVETALVLTVGLFAVSRLIHDTSERKRAGEELRLAALYVRGLIEASLDSLVTIGSDGKITDVNRATELVTGVSREPLIGSDFSDYFTEPEKAREGYQRAFSQGAVENYPLTIRHTSGRTTDVLYNASVYKNEAGEVQGVFVAARDITERKQAEEELRRANRALTVLSECNQAVIRATEEPGLLHEICRLIVEVGGYRLAWVGFAEHDEQKTVPPVAQAGYEEGYLDTLNITWADTERGRGPTGTAIRTGEPVIATNILTDPDYAPWRTEATQRGYASSIALPLIAEGQAFGVLNIYAAEPDALEAEEEVKLLTELASDLAFGIVVLRIRAERKRAEEALRKHAERLRTLRAIDGAILAAWSPEEIAQAAMRHMRRLVPCLGAGVVLFDFEAQEAALLAADVNGEIGLGTGTRLPLEGAADVEALRQGKVLVEEDILALPQPPLAIRTLQAAGVRSYVAASLIAHGELIGALILGAESPGAFAPEHVDIAREVADQIAVAIRQARLHAALEAEEQRLEALVEHLPEGILLLDGERRILVSNPAAQTCLPVLTDAAVGDVLTLMADRPVAELLRSPPEGLWHELEVPGPPRRVFEVVARPVAAGLKAEGWMLVIRDVTEEREVQQRVQQQERLAAVGQLAGGIAHDFNNLLTTIMLYAQVPLGKSKRDLHPDLKRAFETILDESRQAAKLVQQILDFSRRSPIRTQPVNLKPFVKEAIRILERTIPESIRLRFGAGPEEYVVNADPTRVQQVLMNLVLNARDAMPEGGDLRIDLSRVTVEPGDEPPVAEMIPGEWICLAVSDTGTGIPPDVLAHIFEPFFTTKPAGRGTGLGLAQVYGIVAQHEGHINVETEVGKGTIFRVYLPAYQSEAEESPLEEAVLVASREAGETILLVEDQQRIREIGQRVLESLGYRVLTAANGREALEIHQAMEGARPEQSRRIDLVITDVVMPEMGGKQLMRELRKANPDLKALAITGYLMQEDLEALKEVGFLDVIHKPLDTETLAKAVRRALDEN